MEKKKAKKLDLLRFQNISTNWFKPFLFLQNTKIPLEGSRMAGIIQFF